VSANSPKPILCVGACAWTTIFRVAHLPRGSAKIIPDVAIQIGDGMSATAACAVVRLGGRAAFWARVGDDANGHAAIDSLSEAGLDCSGVRLVAGVKGSFCTVVVDGDGERIVIPRHDPAMPNDASWLPLQRIRDGEFAAVLTEVRWPEGRLRCLTRQGLRASPPFWMPRSAHRVCWKTWRGGRRMCSTAKPGSMPTLAPATPAGNWCARRPRYRMRLWG